MDGTEGDTGSGRKQDNEIKESVDGNKGDDIDLHQTLTDDKDHLEETHDSTLEITKNLSTLNIASSSCSVTECKSDIDQQMLKCSRCKRLTHYECTRLPAYQIYLFTRKNYRVYMCDIIPVLAKYLKISRKSVWKKGVKTKS